jgi:hypothetical protein
VRGFAVCLVAGGSGRDSCKKAREKRISHERSIVLTPGLMAYLRDPCWVYQNSRLMRSQDARLVRKRIGIRKGVESLFLAQVAAAPPAGKAPAPTLFQADRLYAKHPS